MDFQEQENHILKIKKNNNKLEARDGKRSASSAMYRLNCPDKNISCIMAQLLGFFATSKCSPHVIKWFKQTPLSVHVTVLYVPEKCRSETREKTNCDSSWASASVAKNKTNYLYIFFSEEEVMKAEEHEQEPQIRSKSSFFV